MGDVLGGAVEMSSGGCGRGHCRCFEHTGCVGTEEAGHVSRPGRGSELQRCVGWVLKTTHPVIAKGKN